MISLRLKSHHQGFDQSICRIAGTSFSFRATAITLNIDGGYLFEDGEAFY
jgi:hypothetical protein